MHHRLKPLALLVCLAAPLGAQSVADVLARMDAGAAEFTSIKADVRKESYTAVIDDTDVETGTMWMTRGGRAGDLRVRIEFTAPDARAVAFAGDKAQIYYPKIKTVHEYDLGKNKALVESFLLLGFGTQGSELAKNYTIRYLGEEEINGTATDRLEMTPKAASAREKIDKVELWVSRKQAIPLRQKFFAAGGDTTTITYSNIEINPPLKDSDVTLQLPPGVKREYPQR